MEHTLFDGLSADQLERILSSSSHLEINPGDTLIELGTDNSTLYVLYEGEVNIILEHDGSNLTLPVRSGECIGEMSLMLDRPTSASVVAKKPSKVLLIPEDLFWNEIVNSKQGVKNLMRIMTERLSRSNQALTKRMKEELHFLNLEKELDAAGKIQSSMVPDVHVVLDRYPQLDVHAFLKQTRQVGGDFYDVLPLDDDHIYFAIGDASGKGMTAALFMIRSLTALRMTVMNRPFEDLLPEVNRILMRNNEETMFITLFAGVLNLQSGHLRYVNAGHNPTMASQKKEFEPLPMPHGSVLGVAANHSFDLSEMQLQPGDRLFLYTDGVTEASRRSGELFGETRLLETLASTNNSNMRELVTLVEASISEFIAGAPQYDDITILALKYLGS